MTSSMLRRQLKNLVQNYSEAEVKVREATSNDPWGPSSSQMADISDLTYNAVACSEIMTMLWKRLKDDKNWRHIHKSLTLLEYLLKTGDDRVLLKMKDNIYIVKALTEYRFIEKDGKDQGGNVREKAKVVLVLMEDDEKLKEERDFAFKTREKTSKGAAASSADAVKDPNYKPCYVAGAAGLPSLDNIPSVADLTASFAARKEERLRQEVEKKETERRANMTEDELQWEDAGKTSGCKDLAWGGEQQEKEDKSDLKEPKEAAGPWGTAAGPDSTDTAASGDAWGAPSKMEKDSFAADKMEEDTFAAPKNGEDPFNAPTNSSDPFNAPRDKEDPFAAPKDKPDPFSSSDGGSFNTPKDDPFKAPKDDPFNAPKDDPFNAPKDDPFNAPKDDPFNAPKDDPFNAQKDDPFNTPKDDRFNAPKDDPFNALKDDPFNAPKDDPFNAPKDDPFNAPKDDPFNAPKDDPFNAPKDDPFNALKDDPFNAPKDDPFNALKDDPFSAPKDDAFTAPASTPPKEDPFGEPTLPKDDLFAAPTSPPKEDPFSAPTKLSHNDPFAAPTTPPKEDPFSSPPKPIKDDPFTAPTPPPKDDPFAAPSTPPKDDASDPFSAPPAGSPQDNKDTWLAPASSPPARSADPWDAPAAPSEVAWGNGASATSPVNNSDPFGDVSQTDNDPWGAPAPVSTDDAWGAPAPPTDSSPSADPFGDGASKSNDPWGAPSNTNGNNTAEQTVQEEETYRQTASFLGSAGASLVDLDDLFCSHPKPKQRSLINALATQTQAIGAFKARGMASAPTVRSGAFAEASALRCNPFSSIAAPSRGAISSACGAAAPPSGAPPLFQLPSHTPGVSHSAVGVLQAAQAAPQPDRGSLNVNSQCGAVGMVQSSFPASIFWDPGAAHQERGGDLLSSRRDETDRKNTNPFLF